MYVFCWFFVTLIGLSDSYGIDTWNRYADNFERPCQEVHVKKQFIIASPNYRYAYYPGEPVTCSYLLKGPKCATNYNFQLLNFNLEGCAKDRLEVQGQDYLCGTQTGIKTYFAENGSLYLKFITEAYYYPKGFRILVTRQPCLTNQPTSSPPKCCENIYQSKKFYLTSPNFSGQCAYQIRKASENVCRMRINFIFFCNSCKSNSLQIDNTTICGKQNGLKLTSTFSDSDQKEFVFRGDGNGGFLLEVTQDECPKKINRETRYRDPSDDAVLKHIYYFVSPDDEDGYRPQIDTRDVREESTYKDSSVPHLLNSEDGAQCENEFEVFTGGPLWQGIPVCNTALSKPLSSNCVELNLLKGYFQSPGYPFYYPGNLNLCYRFKKYPGFCAVNVAMLDFQIENSVGCRKDYLALEEGFKYCGSTLYHMTWKLNLQNKEAEQFYFVTDDYYCGRGFHGIYEQIPCQTTEHPDVPVTPGNNFPDVDCKKIIQDTIFSINVDSYSTTKCSYVIKKSAQNVCKLQLAFSLFNLLCNSEVLTIKGRPYCGKVPNSLTLDFTDDILITYELLNPNPLITGLRLQLTGTQVTEGCDPYQVPDVDIQRIISPRKLPNKELQIISKNASEAQVTEICEIIGRITNSISSENFCQDLLKDHQIESCVIAKIESIQSSKIRTQPLLEDTEDVTERDSESVEAINCDEY